MRIIPGHFYSFLFPVIINTHTQTQILSSRSISKYICLLFPLLPYLILGLFSCVYHSSPLLMYFLLCIFSHTEGNCATFPPSALNLSCSLFYPGILALLFCQITLYLAFLLTICVFSSCADGHHGLQETSLANSCLLLPLQTLYLTSNQEPEAAIFSILTWSKFFLPFSIWSYFYFLSLSLRCFLHSHL